jgi:hypothetical protein
MKIKNSDLVFLEGKYYVQRSHLQKKISSNNYLLNISLLNLISNCSESIIKIKARYYIPYNEILKFIWNETKKITKQFNIDKLVNKFIKNIRERDTGIYLKYNNIKTFKCSFEKTNCIISCLNCSSNVNLRYKNENNIKECGEIRCIKCYLNNITYQKKIEDPLTYEFNNEQKDAIIELYNNIYTKNIKKLLLKGSAGSGKTTVISYVCSLREFSNMKLVFSATTNKAVGVLKKTYHDNLGESSVQSQFIEFLTIQKLINIKRDINENGISKFIAKKDANLNIYNYDIIVIDESSMLTKEIIEEIDKIQFSLKGIIIFVGDEVQLPPVNENTSKIFSCIKNQLILTNVMRSSNNIVLLCNEVRKVVKDSKYIISIKKFKGNGIIFYKDENEWLNNYINVYKKGDYPIFLTYTNELCNNLNIFIRNNLFNNPNEKYVENESIIFNNFYIDNKCKKIFYTSQKAIVIHKEINDIYTNELKFKDIIKDSFTLNLDPKGISNLDLNLSIIEGVDSYDRIIIRDNTNISYENNKICIKLEILKKLINKSNTINYKIWKLRIIDDIKEVVKKDYNIIVLHDSSIELYKKHMEDISLTIKNIKELIDKKYYNQKIIKEVLNEYVIKPIWNFVYENFIDLFADISYGYGITVHKSQGSGYDNVFVHLKDILNKNKNEIESKQCMYTGLSRASKNLHILL